MWTLRPHFWAKMFDAGDIYRYWLSVTVHSRRDRSDQVASETVRTFLTFSTHSQNPKTWLFTGFFICCTRFLEHSYPRTLYAALTDSSDTLSVWLTKSLRVCAVNRLDATFCRHSAWRCLSNRVMTSPWWTLLPWRRIPLYVWQTVWQTVTFHTARCPCNGLVRLNRRDWSRPNSASQFVSWLKRDEIFNC